MHESGSIFEILSSYKSEKKNHIQCFSIAAHAKIKISELSGHIHNAHEYRRTNPSGFLSNRLFALNVSLNIFRN